MAHVKKAEEDSETPVLPQISEVFHKASQNKNFI